MSECIPAAARDLDALIRSAAPFPHAGAFGALLHRHGVNVRYALHVMHTKNISDWTALDKEEAGTWIRRWIGEDTPIPYAAWAILCDQAGLGVIWKED